MTIRVAAPSATKPPPLRQRAAATHARGVEVESGDDRRRQIQKLRASPPGVCLFDSFVLVMCVPIVFFNLNDVSLFLILSQDSGTALAPGY